MISRSLNGASVSLALLLALVANQQVAQATFDPLGGAAAGILGGAATGAGAAASLLGSHLNPLLGGALGGGVASSAASAAAAGGGATDPLGMVGGLAGGMKMAQGITSGLTAGLTASVGDLGRNLGLGSAMGKAASAASAASAAGGAPSGFMGPFGGVAGFGNPMMQQMSGAASAASSAESAGGSSASTASSAAAGASNANEMLGGPSPAIVGPAVTAGPSDLEAAAGAASAASAAGGAMAATNTMASAHNAALAAATGSSPVAARTAIAMDAMKNAQAESALAGSEMVAHGANNARSASLASNAYRNAKLASARDRVNIAGTIQNTARISDATIATHDAATKAEDSLLGSELAVDSASTVLDSDGAYIPPVTSSLLRSLPYGRLGIRNIIPKPLTHPTPGLPDVWLNGFPVKYGNVPVRSYPPSMFGFGPVGAAFPAGLAPPMGAVGAIAGGLHFMQPFTSNNGLALNGMVFDPAHAYLTTNLNGVLGTTVVPLLANGQLEAQDEVAMANLLQMQQLNGVGMPSTYQGYGRLNPVPMITGSVTDTNLMPTTTIGTTYPIGSTLVIEPRDSFFQDYNDNASSRQNFDERQQ